MGAVALQGAVVLQGAVEPVLAAHGASGGEAGAALEADEPGQVVVLAGRCDGLARSDPYVLAGGGVVVERHVEVVVGEDEAGPAVAAGHRAHRGHRRACRCLTERPSEPLCAPYEILPVETVRHGSILT